MMKKPVWLFLSLFSLTAAAAPLSQQELAVLWQQDPEQAAQSVLSDMSRREKIAQLMMPDFRYQTLLRGSVSLPVTAITTPVRDAMQQLCPGGVVLFRENLIDTRQTVALINDFQATRCRLPLFIGTDQEGGYITRLRVGTEMPGNMALGAARNPEFAQQAGDIHGRELAALGFNMNFGPVVDLNNNQNNPVIGVRAYSDRPELTTQLSAAYIRGIQQHRILTAVKHFPGHGNVDIDSHSDLPVINVSKSAWQNTEFPPFLSALQQGSDAVMTAHIVVPSLDDQKIKTLDGKESGTPATLSKVILTKILRHDAGFKGLIITDAMDMKAISEHFDIHTAVEQSILAGADIILMPVKIWDQAAVERLGTIYQYLEEQAEHNPELQRRIDESAERIVMIKLKKKLSSIPVSADLADNIVGSVAHKQHEDHIADHAVTLIKNDHILPFRLKAKNKIVVISDETPRNQLITKHLQDIARDTGTQIIVREKKIKLAQNNVFATPVRQLISGQDLIILVTYNLTDNPANAQRIINEAGKMHIPLAVIASRNPYDIAYLQDVKANIAIYGITGFDITNGQRNTLETNIRSGLRTLFADKNGTPLNNPTGRLPVDINDPTGKTILYPYGTGEHYELMAPPY